ncbi:MAG: phenylacetate--CoA ligase family protein [Hormoscilla sp. GM102CHS1]|nr:phenylacetate--CoA ligase family protein [Hormoscilla sp. GM102CHS1]
MQLAQRQRAADALAAFMNTSLEGQLLRCQSQSPESAVVRLFHRVVASVPAYQAFLQEAGIDPDRIQTFADFQKLPLVTKQNYHSRYSLGELTRHGQLSSCDLIAVSSGSTGQPTFWPRFVTDELDIATRLEQIFHDSFSADTRSTLAVVCFTLGTWVGGMFTTSCCRYLASKGYPITLITPGNNKREILRVIPQLAPNFEQVVLLGYPPFLKDAIDTGIAEGIEWGGYGIKLVTAGEVFSESWRSLVLDRVGSANPCYDSASLYGTADAGVLGNETPLSICIRQFLASRPEAARRLFGESRLPTLAQYDPLSRFFETIDGTLVFSGDNGIPLLRYHIGDRGGIIEHDAMLEFLKEWGFDPISLLQSQGTRGVHRLPFVYVFGRSNFAVSYFGANIYPENVMVGLEQPEIRDWVTGKFVIQVKTDADRNSVLDLVVELALGVEGGAARERAIASEVRTQLLRLNSEFANYVPPSYQTPQVRLAPTGDREYFPVGVKHRYTRL